MSGVAFFKKIRANVRSKGIRFEGDAIFGDKHAAKYDRLAVRAALNAELQNLTVVSGLIVVEVDSTDCDGTRGNHLVNLLPTAIALEHFDNKVRQDAEGPTHVRVLTPREVKAWHRDVKVWHR